MDQGTPYRLIEPTYEVEGGTPIEALEHDLNRAWDQGYAFQGMAEVREPGGELVPVVVLKKRDAI